MEYQGFGNGSDGALVVAASGSESPVDSGAVGTSGTTSLSATNASFAANQLILIHQSRGSGAGSWELNFIASYSAGTITTQFPLVNSYNSTSANKAQVRVVPQYSSVTINGGVTYSVKAWNGSVGGIMAMVVNGEVNVNGYISANGSAGSKFVSNGGRAGGATGGGFRGGNGYNSSGGGGTANCGEGTGGDSAVTQNRNGNGGGGGQSGDWAGGAGGGNASAGGQGYHDGGDNGYPQGGSATGQADMGVMVFGGGGGGGEKNYSYQVAGGGSGAGIVFIMAQTININGYILCNGGNGGGLDLTGDGGAGGAGAGGCIYLIAQVASIGTNQLQCLGGTGATVDRKSGSGGYGWIRVNACQMTGSTTYGSYSTSVGGHDFCQTFIHIYGT